MHSKDPFAKVKDLISDMLAKLEAEAEADATEKAYCDKELGETNTKKADKTAEIEKQHNFMLHVLSSKILNVNCNFMQGMDSKLASPAWYLRLNPIRSHWKSAAVGHTDAAVIR